jgi:hypothetical protein
MKKFKVLLMSLACTAALAVSTAAMTLNTPQNTTQSDACCDVKDCCKAGDKDMSCCKKTKHHKNAHACCSGKDGAASCCCKGDSCPMPNKKTGGSTSGN